MDKDRIQNTEYSSQQIIKPKSGYQLIYKYLRDVPIRQINFTDSADKAMYDRMVKLVNRMLDLHKKLAAAMIPDDKTKIQRQIDATDKQIDSLIYKLYGLTDEEIKIVEGR